MFQSIIYSKLIHCFIIELNPLPLSASFFLSAIYWHKYFFLFSCSKLMHYFKLHQLINSAYPSSIFFPLSTLQAQLLLPFIMFQLLCLFPFKLDAFLFSSLTLFPFHFYHAFFLSPAFLLLFLDVLFLSFSCPPPFTLYLPFLSPFPLFQYSSLSFPPLHPSLQDDREREEPSFHFNHQHCSICKFRCHKVITAYSQVLLQNY